MEDDEAFTLPRSVAYRCDGIESTFNTFITNAIFLAFIGFQIQQRRPTFTLLLTFFSIAFGAIGYIDYTETLKLCHYEQPFIFLVYFVVFGIVEATIVGIAIAEFFLDSNQIL